MTGESKTTEGRVRRIDGRLYITLGGIEHGVSDGEAEGIVRGLASRLGARFIVVDRTDLQTPFASCLGHEEAKERLRQINVISYQGMEGL